MKLKLTTPAACRVARIDRDRFNEEVAAGNFNCAPSTIPGRARLFDPDDMVALWLFRDLLEDGESKRVAGRIACKISQLAREYPEDRTISLVKSYFNDGGTAMRTKDVPDPSEWDKILIGGTDIKEVRTFRIGKMRDMIAHATEEERAVIGERD
ncbi:MAG: hypothetical protein ABJL67_22780 [Sulfitobacter sp.]